MDRMNTKEILANAFINLLEKKPMDKISVSDIASACHASRQTFYNHFQDRDALIMWIVAYDIQRAGYDLADLLTFREYVIRHLAGMQQHRVFYTKMLKSVAYQSFHQVAKTTIMDAINAWIEAAQKEPATPEQAFCLNLYCHGYMFAVREWFLSGQKMSREEVANCVMRSVPESLKPFLL